MTVTEPSRISPPFVIPVMADLTSRHREKLRKLARRAADAPPVAAPCSSAWERRAQQRLEAWWQRDECWAKARLAQVAAVARGVDAEMLTSRRLSALIGGLGGLLAVLGLAVGSYRAVVVGASSELLVWTLVLLCGVLVSGVCYGQARVSLRIREAKIADRLGCSTSEYLATDWAEPIAHARHDQLRYLVEHESEPHGIATSLPMTVRDPRELPEGALRELAREWASFSR